jgi:hypothetical protein
MRYEPLRAYLSRVSEPTLTLSYKEIEGLLGRRLPPTAYGKSWRQWWANTETHSQALAWLRAGWRVVRPDLANKRVEFRRETVERGLSGATDERADRAAISGRQGDPPDRIVLSRATLTPSALRMLEDAAEETEGDLGRALAELINRASLARRRQLLDWFTEHAPGTGTSSVAMIREDRDGR